jgi:Ca2+-dependent lipid-binding protein
VSLTCRLDQAIGSTRTLKRTIAPAWEHAQEFLVTDKPSAVVGVKIVDERGLSTDPVLGYVNVKLSDLLDAKAKQKDWFPLSGCSTGRVRMTAEFKPVLMTGAFNGAQAYSAPIGVVRLWFKRGVDLKNVETLTGGKSDPYVRVLERGIVMARTEVVNNKCAAFL